MITNNTIIQQTIDFVKETLKDAEGGHDWWHIYRVWNNAKSIAKNENVDLLIVELGALLHDIADSKFHGGDEEIGPRIAKEFMLSININSDILNHVIAIIENISFSKSKGTKNLFKSLELDVVQDADRLDAIGAIGIARTFKFGGFKNNAIYNPNLPPQLNMTKEEYKKSEGTTINHFYEKLLLLKDKINTSTGLKMAEQRHEYMEGYLKQFYQEWEGKL